MIIPPSYGGGDGEGTEPVADVRPASVESPTNGVEDVERHNKVVKKLGVGDDVHFFKTTGGLGIQWVTSVTF